MFILSIIFHLLLTATTWPITMESFLM
jgi:hypothetical protein